MIRSIKVCGASSGHEVDEVARGGADTIGLWWGVEGSPRSLMVDNLAKLASHAHLKALEPCLVTFSADSEAIAQCMRLAQVHCVQLHGFQPPGVVERLQRMFDGRLRVLKVLHCAPEGCIDLRYAGAYARSGVTGFIVDGMHENMIGIAMTHADWRLQGTGLDGRPLDLAGRGTVVSRRQADETWRIIFDDPVGV